ncbi:MAG: DUF72 domain-containing protein [Desulfuromonadales bacterium]|nr:DUF72 domain-containing protein [Desulfuromonadales bacterium]
MKLRVGTSGFAYREWLGKFYPPGLGTRQMLPFYANRFSSVEINATFYRMPAPTVLESWRSQVPEEFVFTFKAPGLITHRQRLRNAEETTAAFTTRVSALGRQLGPVLFQLPPYLPCNLPLLADFLAPLTRIRAAFEFRHPSWFNDQVYTVLRERSCALCLADHDGAPPPPFIATTDFGYLRLRRGNYTDSELQGWKRQLAAAGWGETFVFFRHEETARGPALASRMERLDPVR